VVVVEFHHFITELLFAAAVTDSNIHFFYYPPKIGMKSLMPPGLVDDNALVFLCYLTWLATKLNSNLNFNSFFFELLVQASQKFKG
jgi:hypothetical protein